VPPLPPPPSHSHQRDSYSFDEGPLLAGGKVHFFCFFLFSKPFRFFDDPLKTLACFSHPNAAFSPAASPGFLLLPAVRCAVHALFVDYGCKARYLIYSCILRGICKNTSSSINTFDSPLRRLFLALPRAKILKYAHLPPISRMG